MECRYLAVLLLLQFLIQQWSHQCLIKPKCMYYRKDAHWQWIFQTVPACLLPPQLSAYIVLTERLKVNVIMLVQMNWGEPIRRSQGGFLSRLGPPSETGFGWSIQNYTGHLRSCLVTKDLWGGGAIWVTKGDIGMLASQTTEKDFFYGLKKQKRWIHLAVGTQIYAEYALFLPEVRHKEAIWVSSKFKTNHN